MKPPLKVYFKPVKPAYLITGVADVLAGFTIAGVLQKYRVGELLSMPMLGNFLFLLVATLFLYAGGMVLSAALNTKSRLLAIQANKGCKTNVVYKYNFGIAAGFLFSGTIAAFLANRLAGFISLGIVFLVVLYETFLKYKPFVSPIVMGLVRGLNLLLGVAVIGFIPDYWVILIPAGYMAATMVLTPSQGKRIKKRDITVAALTYVAVMFFTIKILVFETFNILHALPFIVLLTYLVFKPLVKAFKQNSEQNTKHAFKAAFICLIVLDACIAAGYSHWLFGLLVLMLLPLSHYFLKKQTVLHEA